VTLLIVAAAWLAGAGVAALGLAEAWPALMLFGAGASTGLMFVGRKPEALLLAVAMLAALVSITRYEASRPSTRPGAVAVFNDAGEVRLRGWVTEEPVEHATSQSLRLAVEAIVSSEGGDWTATKGNVQVSARLFPSYHYGDVLELAGNLETPPSFEDFDYRDYLARRGIDSVLSFPRDVQVLDRGRGSDVKRGLIDVRSGMGDALRRSLPEPEAALARGILLGQQSAIPQDVANDFNAAGISHLIAISGYNVMLVAGFVVAALAWLIGRRQATLAAMAAVLLFTVFVGATPSVLRAAAMAILMLGATLAGRPGSALTAVVIAGAVLTAWQPLLIDDVSFQLSFAATVGIVLLAERLRDLLLPLLRWLPPGPAAFLAEQLSVTTAASIAVTPIIAGSFGRLSVVSLPANLLAAPLFTWALAGSAFTSIAGLAGETAGHVAGDVAVLPLEALIGLARVAASPSFASLDVERFGGMEAAGLYLLMALAVVGIVRRPQEPDEEPPSPRLPWALTLAGPLLIAAAFVWWGNLVSSDNGLLRVTVLDVGQGDAILVETPSGHTVLVDGGPSGPGLVEALGEASPGLRRIDLMALSHGQEDHVTGLIEALERYEVDQALAGPLPGTSGAYQEWRREVGREDVPLHIAAAGQWVDLGDGVRLEVLAPGDLTVHGGEDILNDNSLVLRLVYGDTSFLLTGDLSAAGESALLDAGFDLHSTVLKVGHHGSDGSTTRPFLDAVSPAVAAISAGADNPFGHPSPTLRLRLASVPVFRTDLNGNVTFESDGHSVKVEPERGAYERGEALAAR
jgi:competence protein ComEC